MALANPNVPTPKPGFSISDLPLDIKIEILQHVSSVDSLRCLLRASYSFYTAFTYSTSTRDKILRGALQGATHDNRLAWLVFIARRWSSVPMSQRENLIHGRVFIDAWLRVDECEFVGFERPEDGPAPCDMDGDLSQPQKIPTYSTLRKKSNPDALVNEIGDMQTVVRWFAESLYHEKTGQTGTSPSDDRVSRARASPLSSEIQALENGFYALWLLLSLYPGTHADNEFHVYVWVIIPWVIRPPSAVDGTDTWWRGIIASLIGDGIFTSDLIEGFRTAREFLQKQTRVFINTCQDEKRRRSGEPGARIGWIPTADEGRPSYHFDRFMNSRIFKWGLDGLKNFLHMDFDTAIPFLENEGNNLALYRMMDDSEDIFYFMERQILEESDKNDKSALESEKQGS
ncbi:hypothetical protein ABW19_dt0204317 [Dactylella cylindrospora]|nr:hypothetical protein ABW19_dt0204317 [Dactylella cylindrospora]